MKLGDLMGDARDRIPKELADRPITGLTADSRAVGPGFLFAALPGASVDGRRFIADALGRGAAAILATPDTASMADLPSPLPLVTDPNPRRRLALAAAAFYGAQPETVVGVTGTNGKTSVTSFVQQIWARLGRNSASLGTLGIRARGFARDGSLTTPDPVSLHADLAGLAGRGVSHLAIEASSHGLDQYRLDGIRFAAAAFTNLSRDHLDYHPTMEAYRDAKLRLFTELLPPGSPAILNADSDAFLAFRDACRQRDLTVVEYGRRADAEGLRLTRLDARPFGLSLGMKLGRLKHGVDIPLYGSFQGENALCALALVHATGGDFGAAIAALALLEGAPGRMEKVAERNGAPIFVDYAHTPEALATVLAAVRPHVSRRLVLVFGAGGDRDPGKRPLMGAAAAAGADEIYVTDDNPRSEDPARIRAAILAACPEGKEIDDRREAIAVAVGRLRDGDALVVAGKGHERGQIVGDRVLPFDDREIAREAARGAAS